MVYDILGRPVRRLIEEKVAAGVHAVNWDEKDGQGHPMASGVYLYVLQVEGEAELLSPAGHRIRQVRRMMLLK